MIAKGVQAPWLVRVRNSKLRLSVVHYRSICMDGVRSDKEMLSFFWVT